MLCSRPEDNMGCPLLAAGVFCLLCSFKSASAVVAAFFLIRVFARRPQLISDLEEFHTFCMYGLPCTCMHPRDLARGERPERQGT